jgi:Iron-containing redox enzyme
MTSSINFADSGHFSASIIAAENELIRTSGIRHVLRRVASSRIGVRAFAAAFYFVRVNFVKHNFILGARLGSSEKLWAPLVKNLAEELGGIDTPHPSHNELYRRFLADCHLRERELIPLPFSEDFDRSWTEFVQHEEPGQALLALGVYELLDGPDYTFMRDELRYGGMVSEVGLEFFEAHAEVRHFDMFEDVFEPKFSDTGSKIMLQRSVDFVLSTQMRMWQGLSGYLEAVALQ